jgi:hypothetical protein
MLPNGKPFGHASDRQAQASAWVFNLRCIRDAITSALMAVKSKAAINRICPPTIRDTTQMSKVGNARKETMAGGGAKKKYPGRALRSKLARWGQL